MDALWDGAAARKSRIGEARHHAVRKRSLNERMHVRAIETIEAALAEVVPWVDSGMLRWKMDVVEGIERMPVAVNKLFDGTNDGKLVVRV